jgi:pilus assembly protein CpaB
MNKRLLTILLLAFVIAGACSFLVYKMVGNKLGAASPAGTRVVAAAADIKIGTLLAPANLTTIEISGTPPKGAILDPKNALNRGVVADIYQGEPILDNRLAPVGSGGGLAATIPTGMRAIAVKVDDIVGVAGFATPGMHVDVLASGTPPGNNGGDTRQAQLGILTKTILQNITVLSAGVSMQKDPEGKPQSVQVVNLLVTPEEAETLSLMTTGVKIQLVLRNPLDTKTDPVEGTAMGNIFAAQNIAPPPHVGKVAVKKAAPAAQPFSIEVINGSKRSEEKFASPEAKQ